MLQSQELEEAGLREAEEARIVLLASTAAKGDDDAFAELYSLLSPRVFNLVLRSVHDRPTAEDLCQEIWLRAHREIRSLRTPEAFRAWIYRIASHSCVDFARSSRGKHRGEEDAIDELIVSYRPEPEDSAILQSEMRMVWESLGSMAPRQSMALYLRQIDGLSYDEIGEILGCGRPTVEALLFRARQSFSRTFSRVEASASERCSLFSQVMAAVIDDQPTQLQRSALESHASDCQSCRAQLADTRRANRAYLSLPLLPIGKGLALEVLLAGGGTAAGGGLFTAAAAIFAGSALPAKLALLGVLVAGTGAVATGTITVPVVSESIAVHPVDDEPATPGITTINGIDAATTAQEASTVVVPSTTSSTTSTTSASDGADATATPGANALATGSSAPPEAGSATSVAAAGGASTGSSDTSQLDSATAPQPTETPAPPAGPLTEALNGVSEATTGASQTLEVPLHETMNQLPPLIGDTATDLGDAVATTIDPVNPVVEDITGISLGETLNDVTNALPNSSATAVPLDETLEDVLDPVQDLLDDPLAPVGNLLGPLLPPPAPQPTAAPTPAVPPTAAPAATPSNPPCLLGLFFC